MVIPRLVGLAAAAFVALTVGAVGAQLATGGSVAPAVVLLLISAVVAWGRRRTTTAVAASVMGSLHGHRDRAQPIIDASTGSHALMRNQATKS